CLFASRLENEETGCQAEQRNWGRRKWIGPLGHPLTSSPSYKVDDELELGGLLDWQVGGLGALEDLVHVAGGATEDVSRVHPLGHQTPEFHHFPPGEAAWEPSPGGEVHDESSI